MISPYKCKMLNNFFECEFDFVLVQNHHDTKLQHLMWWDIKQKNFTVPVVGAWIIKRK